MEKIRTVRIDLLIIGNGLAGLRAAAAAAEAGVQVLVVSKGQCASPEIMGFNVPVKPEDTAEIYFKDMMESGSGINNAGLVRILAERVSGEVKYLESIGIVFDRDKNGEYDAIHTLGTTYPRLIHCKSQTGAEGMRLLKKHCKDLGVKFETPVSVLELLTEKEHVLGALAINLESGELFSIAAKAVVLAAGGCGAMQKISTYPKTIVGDGYAMAFRAGAELVDMEFQQYEPCTFVYPPQIEGKVIATTLLRHGAELLNCNGEEFMEKYGLTRESAQKSTLSRAMMAEIKAGRGTPHGGIYYNMTMLSPKFLYEDHKIFTRPAMEMNIDLVKEMPEMIPAAHTNLGGVRINESCGTKIQNLFACGEVIGGLHGANRIGGSAGAETVVFGNIAGKSAAEFSKNSALPEEKNFARILQEAVCGFEALMAHETSGITGENLWRKIGEVMAEYVGISRSAEGLEKAEKEISGLSEELKAARATNSKEAALLCQCRNMLLLARMQIASSLLRKESRGVFYREDFSEQNDAEWKKNIVIKNCGGIELEICRCANSAD